MRKCAWVKRRAGTMMLLLVGLICLAGSVSAQTARKPSFYEYRNQQNAQRVSRVAKPRSDAEVREKTTLPFLDKLAHRSDFDLLSRVYDQNTPSEIPHLLFVIDRQDKDRIYYLNTPRYQLHEHFVEEQKLLENPTREIFNRNYREPDRRFIFGTLSWQHNIKGYTYEFWEGDLLTPQLLQLADTVVHASFFDPILFKTNSTLHEQVAKQIKIPFTTQEALIREQAYMALNQGTAKGKLRIIDSVEATPDIQADDIVVLKEVPIALSPVAGVVTQRPSTVLSHVNLLAKAWGIPNIYVRDAEHVLQQYNGQWVELTATRTEYKIRKIAKPANTPRPAQKVIAKPDLSMRQLLPLSALRAADSKHCGAKASNLGAMNAAHIAGTIVPDGFCIPFAQYAGFMKEHGIDARLAQLEAREDFRSNPAVRQRELELLRQEILRWSVGTQISSAWIQQWQTQLHGNGVFVRSSSNSEDLPNFSGAGLYTTVPNVRSAQALEEAVKQVWASVFNYEAYEARRIAGISHNNVAMGVFVQLAVDSESSGVMITRDPFDATHKNAFYISAKRGLGMRVVEGKKIAEQVMYSTWSNAIQVLSRSGEDTELRLDQSGGIREAPVDTARAVLEADLVRRLAQTGVQIKKLFGDKDQDIEWAIHGNQIILLQARPYVAEGE